MSVPSSPAKDLVGSLCYTAPCEPSLLDVAEFVVLLDGSFDLERESFNDIALRRIFDADRIPHRAACVPHEYVSMCIDYLVAPSAAVVAVVYVDELDSCDVDGELIADVADEFAVGGVPLLDIPSD